MNEEKCMKDYDELMSRAESYNDATGDWYYLSDLAAEFHVDEYQLFEFCEQHLPEDEYCLKSYTATELGASLLRAILTKEK